MERADLAIRTDGLDPAGVEAACRLVLRLVEPATARYETDIPWGPEVAWPEDVERAAELLASRARRPSTRAAVHSATGMLAHDDAEAWAAFVALAPHAWDASAWSADGERLVSLCDAGQSVVVRLTPAQADEVAGVLGPGRLLVSRRRGVLRRRTWVPAQPGVEPPATS